MQRTAQLTAILVAVAVFIGLPLLLYALSDAPRRTLLKEALSILTLLAFLMMIGQFFLARSNTLLLSLFKPPQIQAVHKYVAYSAVAVILAHPVLIVAPRALEGGVRPWDAFVTMITTVESLGVVLGLIAWVVLLVLTMTAVWRKLLITRVSTHYRGWRFFHGGLAVAFTVLGLWHAIDLGRHTGLALSWLLISLVVIGFALLARLYWGDQQRPPTSTPVGGGTAP